MMFSKKKRRQKNTVFIYCSLELFLSVFEALQDQVIWHFTGVCVSIDAHHPDFAAYPHSF